MACEDHDYGPAARVRPATSAPTSPATGSASGSASGSRSGTGSSGSSAEPVQVVTVPSGSVDAGDGSATGGAGEDAAPLVLAAYGAVAASGAAAAVWRTRRSARSRG